MDEAGNVLEEAEFDGDPTFKRRYLEKHRPIGWWPEWLKTDDMRDVGQDPSLIRGRRIRFFNGVLEDIIVEEVIHKDAWLRPYCILAVYSFLSHGR